MNAKSIILVSLDWTYLKSCMYAHSQLININIKHDWLYDLQNNFFYFLKDYHFQTKVTIKKIGLHSFVA